ncbi:MAG: hypothetical protein IJ802_01315 [Kiritimatiellae bacterium]|nr:hypothetical protein [Kiritimatiellia bacterium]
MRKTSILTMAVAYACCIAAAQWEEGMEDTAGAVQGAAVAHLPAADFTGMRHIYPVRDKFQTISLDGTWAFKLARSLATPPEIAGWEQPGYDTREWDVIDVPGNWETQGFKRPKYGNQIEEMAGFYVRKFKIPTRWHGKHVILRFDGVLFGYEVFVNGYKVGEWGSAYNLAQWDITPYLMPSGYNTIAVKVLTRSHAWLFDTNDCFCIAGIQRSVQLFAVPDTYIEDVTVRYGDKVFVKVELGKFGDAASTVKKIYVSFTDDNDNHVLDFVRDASGQNAFEMEGEVAGVQLWSPENPYLYDMAVTLVDGDGGKVQRIVEKIGFKTVAIDGKDILVNGKKEFLKGVCWNETDPVYGRYLPKEERRKAMQLMKKAGINTIRTAHYPFAPDFMELADEMGFYVIDEVPFGSRGSMMLKNRAFKDELIARTEATIRRDKNRASVLFWTFGNENSFKPNTEDVLAYAKTKDPTRPRALPQIGSSQFQDTIAHPELDVDINAGHYLSLDRMEDAEQRTTKPIVQTEYAHSCGNGFNDFERSFARMDSHRDSWSGGTIWLWHDQCILHDPADMVELTTKPDYANRDKIRNMPAGLNGNYISPCELLDSWGDRGTDGIVYGDGTPKDAYWLVKTLYTGAPLESDAEKSIRLSSVPPPGGIGVALSAPPALRVGRRLGLNQQIQNFRKRKPYWHQPFLLSPEILAVEQDGDAASWQVKYTLAEGGEWTGWIKSASDGVVTYSLAPDKKAADAQYLELGLAIAAPREADRIDWIGDGILASVPERSKMCTFGEWTMHKDDYRLQGSRANVAWAAATANHGDEAFALVSGTHRVSFDCIDGTVFLTECNHVSGFGGKAVAPTALARGRDIALEGSFRLLRTRTNPSRPDVAPATQFSHHYGF